MLVIIVRDKGRNERDRPINVYFLALRNYFHFLNELLPQIYQLRSLDQLEFNRKRNEVGLNHRQTCANKD